MPYRSPRPTARRRSTKTTSTTRRRQRAELRAGECASTHCRRCLRADKAVSSDIVGVALDRVLLLATALAAACGSGRDASPAITTTTLSVDAWNASLGDRAEPTYDGRRLAVIDAISRI